MEKEVHSDSIIKHVYLLLFLQYESFPCSKKRGTRGTVIDYMSSQIKYAFGWLNQWEKKREFMLISCQPSENEELKFVRALNEKSYG